MAEVPARGAADPFRARGFAISALFVLLWSTGFIGAKFGLPYADPLTFLSLRVTLVALLMLVAAWLARAPWPRGARAWTHTAIAGLLIQGGYLSGVFCAIAQGLSAGVVALIVGMQPLLTALAASTLFGERTTRGQWVGLLLGVIGVAMVLSNRLGGPMPASAVALALLALVSITAGTLYQKRHGAATDFRTGGVIQYGATALVLAPLAALLEPMRIVWTGAFVFALAWLVLVLSVGAIGLLYALIRRGRATQVTSLFYLTPPVTALMANLMFGETLSPIAIAGMAIAVLGVALVNRVR
jgi:drug/metabolite transporter (DMT)-like permease